MSELELETSFDVKIPQQDIEQVFSSIGTICEEASFGSLGYDFSHSEITG